MHQEGRLTMFPVTRIITHTNQPRRTTSQVLRRSERISNLVIETVGNGKAAVPILPISGQMIPES